MQVIFRAQVRRRAKTWRGPVATRHQGLPLLPLSAGRWRAATCHGKSASATRGQRFLVTVSHPVRASKGRRPASQCEEGADDTNLLRVTATQDFSPALGFYLPLKQGEVVVITEKVDDGTVWFRGYVESDPDQRIGRFPAEFVPLMLPPQEQEQEQPQPQLQIETTQKQPVPEHFRVQPATEDQQSDDGTRPPLEERLAGLPSLRTTMPRDVTSVPYSGSADPRFLSNCLGLSPGSTACLVLTRAHPQFHSMCSHVYAIA